MAEGIETPDGRPLDIEAAAEAKAATEQAFARAMASPPDSDTKAPPRRAEKPDRKTAGAAEKPRVARGPGRPPKAAKSAPSGLSRDVRVQGINGLVGVSAAVLAMAGKGTGDQALSADGVTLAMHADPIAQAVADTADQDERFARVVDRLCTAGPYAALIGVMVGVGSQVARNHGIEIPGTMAPDELLKAAEEQAEASANPVAA